MSAREAVYLHLQELQAVSVDLHETGRLVRHDPPNIFPCPLELLVEAAHVVYHDLRDPPGPNPEPRIRLQRRPAYYASKDVLSTVVAGPYAVSNKESHGTGVVGEHVERALGFLRGAQTHATNLTDALEDRGVEICLVDGVDVLGDSGGTFEAHAGVDTGFGQKGE